MDILVTTVHLIACFILVIVVLIQKGKGADLAGAFGGGGSSSAMGVRSASQLIHKLTIAAAVFFMITSYTLGLIHSTSGSLLSDIESEATQNEQVIPVDDPEQPDSDTPQDPVDDDTDNSEEDTSDQEGTEEGDSES